MECLENDREVTDSEPTLQDDRASAPHVVPDGPQTFEELVSDWPEFGYKRMLYLFGTAARTLFISAMQWGIFLTTHYSGAGTVEYVSVPILDILRQEGIPIGIGFVHHSACDFNFVCRKVLNFKKSISCMPGIAIVALDYVDAMRTEHSE